MTQTRLKKCHMFQVMKISQTRGMSKYLLTPSNKHTVVASSGLQIKFKAGFSTETFPFMNKLRNMVGSYLPLFKIVIFCSFNIYTKKGNTVWLHSFNTKSNVICIRIFILDFGICEIIRYNCKYIISVSKGQESVAYWVLLSVWLYSIRIGLD